MKRTLAILAIVASAALVIGTIRDADFWRTPDQRGDALFRAGRYADAAEAYADPARAGVALYRNGDFEAAAKAFARVPGADGAFDQGNALLMHGKYGAAVASYDHALVVRPGWPEARDNKAVALARKAKIDAAGQDRDQEKADAYDPDQIVFDQKGDDRNAKPIELSAGGPVGDAEFQATWLRRVRTTPAQFLRAKFAYQAANGGAK